MTAFGKGDEGIIGPAHKRRDAKAKVGHICAIHLLAVKYIEHGWRF